MHKRNSPKGIDFWNHHVAKFNSNGMSMRAYCIKEGLSTSSFHKYTGNNRDVLPVRTSPRFIEIGQEHTSPLSANAESQSIRVLSLSIPMDYPLDKLTHLLKNLHSC